jgi:hypothetical protein
MIKETGLCLVLLILVFDSLADAKKTIYETGTVIDVAPEYMESPAPLDGPILPPPQILIGYSVEIQVGSFMYFVDAAMCCPLRSKYKLEWAARDQIEFRFDKGGMFVKRPNGKELKARLVKVVQASANSSSSQPSFAPGPQFRPLSERAKHGKKVPLGIDFLRADDMCLILDGALEADDFFSDLRGGRTADGAEFRKGTQRVTTFPDILTVRVIAELGTCTLRERKAVGDISSMRNVRFDEEFMRSVTFEGSWKDGFDQKPAELGPVAEGRIPNPTPLPNYRDWWEYEFEVRSKGVSLNDALVIVVQSPDGKMVARLSARLPNGL